MLPGACSLLQELREAGIKIAIGSASKNAREVAERLGLFCFIEALSDGESVLQQKPAPDLFLHAAEQLGCLPKDCVVVEDSEVGVQAALAGGFWTVGLGPNKRVGAAHLVFPDLRGVKLGQILDALHQPKQC
jgi:HAD superfamily hydrolase (TIGR01509 family)